MAPTKVSQSGMIESSVVDSHYKSGGNQGVRPFISGRYYDMTYAKMPGFRLGGSAPFCYMGTNIFSDEHSWPQSMSVF